MILLISYLLYEALKARVRPRAIIVTWCNANSEGGTKKQRGHRLASGQRANGLVIRTIGLVLLSSCICSCDQLLSVSLIGYS